MAITAMLTRYSATKAAARRQFSRCKFDSPSPVPSVRGGQGGIYREKSGHTSGKYWTGNSDPSLERKGPPMVKGITRQVILVKSPDPKLFEEAIFIVKDEALAREGVDADQVLREARQAADGYLKQGRAWNRRLSRLPGPAWGAGGALLASFGWIAWLFLL